MFDFLRRLGIARISAMVLVGLGMVGFFAFIMVRVTAPQYVPLYSELSMRDMQEIVKRLDSKAIPYELKNDGSTIWVPKTNIARLKMSLAADGIPAGGSVGNEIFDRGDSLGTTSAMHNVNTRRALEGELARTIQSLRNVSLARVHLVLPEKKLFSRQKAEASASITIRVLGEIDKASVKAIQFLVASAVPGLKTSNVAIIDERGRTLASGNGEEAGLGLSNSFDERTVEIETRLKKEIEYLVNTVVGRDKARVKVTAELQLDSFTERTQTFDPDGSVLRSAQSNENTNNSENNEQQQGVTLGNDLPNAAAENSGDSNNSKQNGTSISETNNYEISNTVKTTSSAAGKIIKISVAVLVDGVEGVDADGKVTYEPRPQDELDKINAMVRTAIGFDKGRGDVVNVINLRFVSTATTANEIEEPGMFEFTKQELFRIAELGTLFLIAIIVLFMVIKPLIKRVLSPEEMEQPLLMDTANITHTVNAAGQPIAILPDGTEVSPAVIAAIEEKKAPRPQISAKLETALATGELQQATIKHVGEIVSNNPDETLSIIRSWLTEGEESKRAIPL